MEDYFLLGRIFLFLVLSLKSVEDAFCNHVLHELSVHPVTVELFVYYVNELDEVVLA